MLAQQAMAHWAKKKNAKEPHSESLLVIFQNDKSKLSVKLSQPKLFQSMKLNFFSNSKPKNVQVVGYYTIFFRVANKPMSSKLKYWLVNWSGGLWKNLWCIKVSVWWFSWNVLDQVLTHCHCQFCPWTYFIPWDSISIKGSFFATSRIERGWLSGLGDPGVAETKILGKVMLLKLRFCEKGTKFLRNHHLRFRKNLWPSQSIWTLLICKTWQTRHYGLT